MSPKDKFEQVTITLSKADSIGSINSVTFVSTQRSSKTRIVQQYSYHSLSNRLHMSLKDHSVRLRFTGADAQNFYIESIDGRSTSWRVYHDQTRIRLRVTLK